MLSAMNGADDGNGVKRRQRLKEEGTVRYSRQEETVKEEMRGAGRGGRKGK